MNEDEIINELDNFIPKWFAIYTKSKSEKKVYEQLIKNGFESYLPLKRELKEWSDRNKIIETPLFTSYVFVKVTTKDYYKIPPLIVGFLRFAQIGKNKIAIREKEIETIKLVLQLKAIEIESNNEKLESSEKIEIVKGLLKGKQGFLVEIRGKKRVAIRIETLEINLLVEIDRRYIKKITEKVLQLD